MAVAKHFKNLMKEDNRFTPENDVDLDLVCFRLVVPGATSYMTDKVNLEFLQVMNESGEIHMVPTKFHGKVLIRFCVTAESPTTRQIGI